MFNIPLLYIEYLKRNKHGLRGSKDIARLCLTLYLPWTGPPQMVKIKVKKNVILINKKWRTSLQYVRVRREPDIRSDYYLLNRKIKLKLILRNSKIKSERHVFDAHKLTDKNTCIRKDFSLELKNRFAALRNIRNIGNTIEKHRNSFRNTHTDTCKKVPGFKNN